MTLYSWAIYVADYAADHARQICIVAPEIEEALSVVRPMLKGKEQIDKVTRGSRIDGVSQ